MSPSAKALPRREALELWRCRECEKWWEALELWRCRECEKWSHAKRRPKKHKRWVSTGAADTDYGHVTYGHFVWCGPFDRYEARHSDHSSPPKLADLNERAPDSANSDGPASDHDPADAEIPF